MAIRVALRHTTRYSYDRPVTFAPHIVRLRPAPHCRTPIQAYSLNIAPDGSFLNWQQDPFGNYQARVVLPEPARELCVDVELIAHLTTINPFDFFLEASAETYPFQYDADLQRDLTAYLQPCPTGPRFARLIEDIRSSYLAHRRRSVDVLVDINQLLQRSLRYDIRMEPGVFSPEETLERGHGSCRDFAWLLTNVLRSLGLGARFVSGYSIQLRPDQKPLEGPAGVVTDCTDLHAWSEAYLPGAGWVGLDATSGLWCGEGHIPLACTPEPTQAAAITGSYSYSQRGEQDGVQEQFHFSMHVERIEDRPRPTKSYTDRQWSEILECGHEIDRLLEHDDVRLTMGGEPTFVSVDDMEGAEWNTLALGPAKEKLGDSLLRRLHQQFAPGGFLHHGQGKWYPGEQLPRWAYSCYFRLDGEPIWQDINRIARGSNGTHDALQACQFAELLCARLGVVNDHVIPAYEDLLYYLWRERRLPVNVDPFDSHLDDELERVRLRRLFTQGLKQVIGYTLPLRAVDSSDNGWAWETGPWLLRDGRLYLLPGDSPMGYRLPLDSLQWADANQLEPSTALDPFAQRPALPAHRILMQSASGKPRDAESAEVACVPGVCAASIVRSALCVEPRHGVLHVFMPPIDRLEPYLQLVAQIEQTATDLDLAVRIEGYAPPSDPRIQRIQVTPDPGVLEVNIHPARTWDQLVSNTTILYDQARLTRLGTDKFMIDGRHTGTGGGNHVVLGGATVQDSPFLRRPDLLRSIVSYFNNHPALSYLFSGLFVGPTSQAPRIDEARQDSLYELEIAFQALDDCGTVAPPWLVDRLFRNLLVDVTGNTHRAEFCIDKLYSPDNVQGRQGLLELRAFEMPPDARMSLAQQLLVRSLVAWFWQRPYRRALQRWGTALQNRFSLPHFLWQDIDDVVSELREDGIGIDVEWFRPHLEFRFPLCGAISTQGVELELRQAIEPWHVLGEEPGAGGSTRYVDSSVERVQVLVNGLVDSRHVVAVNGCPIPLHSTGRSGEFVAGVRYKAWKPPACFHPTLEVDAPLIFDIVDTWANRAIGGCKYFVSHPGGLAHSTYPTNGLEAESRRIARFQPFGHNPGRQVTPRPERSLELPFVLDLRLTRPLPNQGSTATTREQNQR
jgi:uncharacterized protein (DUF2126 family)/transglutaminase-like putative cysteine protease